MHVISWFISGSLCFLLYHFIFCRLICNKKFEITKAILLMALLIGFIYYFLSIFNFEYLRPYAIHIYIFISLWINYKESLVKTILGLFSIFVLVLLSEMLCGVILFIVGINIEKFNEIPFNYFILNIFIFLFAYFLSRTKIFEKISNSVLFWYGENEFCNLVIFVSFALTIAIFILYNNFTKFLPISILLLTNLFCIGIFIFIIGFFSEKAQNNKIAIEYDQLLSYVKVYEDEIEEKSKNQHEHNNQLIVIKNLINSRNKKAIEYIDKQLNSEIRSEDRSWLGKLKYVPQGGLKGLIYYKIQEMLKNNVTIFVDISPQLQELNNNENLNKYLEDISKIVGVYLDNAIQAVNELPEKYIILEFYLEDSYIVFSLSNNYKSKINFDEVDIEGYTTKGYGHGYGLSLVKDILSKNNNLAQRREMNGIYYVQKLYIKK